MNQQAIVQLLDMHRQLDGKGIINGITATISSGNVVALLGKNGSGKTTLLETILGFGIPASGGVSLWRAPAAAIGNDIKQRIGFVPQQDELMPTMTGEEHLQMFQSFRQSWNSSLVERLAAEWLIPVATRVAKMSVGQRQKLSILLALAHEPDLLILDEPVAALDPIARRQFLQQLVEVAADASRAIIFSTHIISDVERVANQVWMLRDGRLAYDGDLDHLKESVVRLNIHSTALLPARLPLANCLYQTISAHQAKITLCQWNPLQKEVLEDQLQAKIEVEYLALEDIFLEMNR